MGKCVVLGDKKVTLNDLILVSRYNYMLEFDSILTNRVLSNRKIVDNFAKHNKLLYGITTGLGNNCTEVIPEKDRKLCQVNTVFSHATSLGPSWDTEVIRSIMFVMIVHLSNGHSGIRLETLEMLKFMLNNDIIPIVPKHGSVGYLSLEAHIALAMLGENDVLVKGKMEKTSDCFRMFDIKPLDISSKEGLSLTSGTTSVTAISALAIYDSIVAVKSLDVICAMTLEVLNANLMSLDERLHSVRYHRHQQSTAYNIRNILEGSKILNESKKEKIQDALSLRAIAQQQGATKSILSNALEVLENELKSSVDNPLIFETDDGVGEAIMGCNADGSYLGLYSDSSMIAITSSAKVSERRINRLASKSLSGLPAFLIGNSGTNNGLMIPHYSALGILGEMKILSCPASTDNGTMSDMQEDYVSMGYNAVKKFYEGVNLFRYIISTELLYSMQGYGFHNNEPASKLKPLYSSLRDIVPFFEKDCFYAPYIEKLNLVIKNGDIVQAIENVFPDFKGIK